MDTSGYDGEAADTTRRGQRRLEPLTSVEGERGVNLGGDTAGDDLEDLGTELDEQTVHGVLGLLLEIVALRLAERDGGVDELLVSGELGSGEAEGVSAGATGKAAGCARCASSFWNRGCVGQDRGRRVGRRGGESCGCGWYRAPNGSGAREEKRQTCTYMSEGLVVASCGL
jgi:hypothetical protein